MKNKKSQNMSLDLIIVIVLLLFGVLFLVVNYLNGINSGSLSIKEDREKSKVIFEQILAEFKKNKIIEDNKLDRNKFQTLSITDLKKNLGIDEEIVIFFEKDGKLVKIDGNANLNCFGSKNVEINDIQCKE